jgi:hypothetical protein
VTTRPGWCGAPPSSACIDYPELLLEVHASTGTFDQMGHISGSHLRRDDLDITLAALTVARSCNVGLVPVIKPGTLALETPFREVSIFHDVDTVPLPRQST